MSRRNRDRKGQDLVEYGALLVIFIMFALLALNAMRSSTGEMYGNIETRVEGARAKTDHMAQPAPAPAPAKP